ncbi:hypothetical protein L1987_22832 [Smallanthus sonchifolius]|uniref:Uncharacterized protein n=1 Tax=Smallanthus sonchifolius TaxID=185202 RepID=A0ACB9IG45_9ASTR|nr:hypothetical protein L1987_22832 [Smallanthus sonchifolius]
MAAGHSIQPGMEEVQQSPPEVVEETQVIGRRNPNLENESVIMNGENQDIPVQLTNKVGEPNDSPRNLKGEQEMDHQASRVKRKKDGFKKISVQYAKAQGIRLRKKPGNKWAIKIGDQIEDLDVGDDDLLMSEEWSEGSDEESISENPFLDTAKEIDETIKVDRK